MESNNKHSELGIAKTEASLKYKNFLAAISVIGINAEELLTREYVSEHEFIGSYSLLDIRNKLEELKQTSDKASEEFDRYSHNMFSGNPYK